MILRKFFLLVLASVLIIFNFTKVEARPGSWFYATENIAIKAIVKDVNNRLNSDCKLYIFDEDKWHSCKAYFGNSKSNKFIVKSSKNASNSLSSIEIVCSKKEDTAMFRKVVSATISAILWWNSDMKPNFERASNETNKKLPYKKTFTTLYIKDLSYIVLEYKVSESYIQSVKITANWID